jgi:hypothetical protein
VVGARLENAHGFVAVPKTADMQPVLVQLPAAVALVEIVGIIVLESILWQHGIWFSPETGAVAQKYLRHLTEAILHEHGET